MAMMKPTQKDVFQEALLHFHAEITNDLTDLLIRYYEPSLYPPQAETTASAISKLYPDVLSEVQLTLLLVGEWERIQMRYGEGKRVCDLLQREKPSFSRIKEAACPFCDHAQLSIVPGTGGTRVECAQCDEEIGVFDRDLLDV
jgi:hypothetical protein